MLELAGLVFTLAVVFYAVSKGMLRWLAGALVKGFVAGPTPQPTTEAASSVKSGDDAPRADSEPARRADAAPAGSTPADDRPLRLTWQEVAHELATVEMVDKFGEPRRISVKAIAAVVGVRESEVGAIVRTARGEGGPADPRFPALTADGRPVAAALRTKAR